MLLNESRILRTWYLVWYKIYLATRKANEVENVARVLLVLLMVVTALFFRVFISLVFAEGR